MSPAHLLNGLWATVRGSRRGMRDVAVSALPQLVGVFTGLFGSVLVARGLGPTGMGQYALAISLAGVAATLSDLGIGQTAIRYASRAAASGDTPGQMAVLRWALRLRLALVVGATGALFLIAPFVAARLWHSEALTPYMRLGLLGGVFPALAAVPGIYFKSIKRFSTNASITSAQRIVSFTGIAALALFGLWSLLNLMVVNLVASAIGALVFLLIVPKDALWPRNPMRKLRGLSFRRLLAGPKAQDDLDNGLDSSTPAGFVRFHMLATVITMLTMQAGVWLMGYFLHKSELGVYSAAVRFTLPLTIALTALNTALWPRASGLKESHQLLGLLKRTFSLSVPIALLMCVYAVCAPLLAPFLFGSAYEHSRALGQVLSLRYCFAALICPVTIVGYSFGLVRIIWVINLMQFFLLVAVNVALLPRIGPMGSALALLIHEVVGSCCVGLVIIKLAGKLSRA